MENHPPSPFVGVQKEGKSRFLVEGLPETAFLFLYPPVRPRGFLPQELSISLDPYVSVSGESS